MIIVVSQHVTTINLVGHIGLCQYHLVKAANMYHPDDLHEIRALSGAYVEGTKGYSPEVRRPTVRWRWRCVDTVCAMDIW